MRRAIVILIIMMSMFVFYGCKSKVPKPTSYDFSTQQKMQAAHHWNILAHDVASQIEKKLHHKYGNTKKALYVYEKSDVPFTDSFYDLLISSLIDRGVRVTTEKQDAFKVKYDVQLIHHSADNTQRPWPGINTAATSTIAGGIAVSRNISGGVAAGLASASGFILGGAALDASYGYMNVKLPRNEVLVTTTVVHDTTIAFKKTDLYYINDKDFWHYVQDKSVHKNNKYKSNEYILAK